MKMIKKVVLIVIPIVLIIISTSSNNDVYQGNVKKEVKISNNGTLALMLETSAGSGEYTPATDSSWPGDGYVFNATRSKCENGSEILWDDTHKKIIMKSNVSDKCYVYFDVYVAPSKYWNDNFPKFENTYAFPDTPSTTYASVSELRMGYGATNFDSRPYYIKTTTEHQICGYYNNKEFCMSANYWLRGDDGSQTKAKLQREIATAFGVSESGLSCNSGSSSAVCFVGEFNLYAESDGRVRLGNGHYFCSAEVDGSAKCWGINEPGLPVEPPIELISE